MKPKWPCFWWQKAGTTSAIESGWGQCHVQHTQRMGEQQWNRHRFRFQHFPKFAAPKQIAAKNHVKGTAFVEFVCCPICRQAAVKCQASRNGIMDHFQILNKGCTCKPQQHLYTCYFQLFQLQTQIRQFTFSPNSRTLRSSQFSHQNRYLHTCEELMNGKRNIIGWTGMNGKHIFIYSYAFKFKTM